MSKLRTKLIIALYLNLPTVVVGLSKIPFIFYIMTCAGLYLVVRVTLSLSDYLPGDE